MATPEKIAPTHAAAPVAEALIACRVRPHNRYSVKQGDQIVPKMPGEIVHVPAAELRQCAHALVALTDETAQEIAAKEEASEMAPGNHYFRQFKAQAIDANRIRADNHKRARIAEMEAMGLTVTAK